MLGAEFMERITAAMEGIRAELLKLNENSCVCNVYNDNSNEPEPPKDPVEEPAEDGQEGVVIVDKVALRFTDHYNMAGYPVMIIWHKKLPVAQRRRFVRGEIVMLGDKVRADGGLRYYQVLNDYDSFGKAIEPEEVELFIPEWAIDLV